MDSAVRTLKVADWVQAGFGVEDIQAKTGIPVDFSRCLIRTWRGARVLDDIRKRGSAALKSETPQR